MKNKEPIDGKIITVINKKITGHTLDEGEEKLLKKWMKSFFYYKTLVDDIDADQELKQRLLQAYLNDKDEFWKIIITYRTALHNGMPRRRGNFWERLFRF